MMVDIKTNEFCLPVYMLQRGFWLYVWQVKTPDGKMCCYVGRTGDSSSPNAASLYNRMGQHLGFEKASNALRTHLQKRDFKPEECKVFRLISCGPIYPEVPGTDLEKHKPFRDDVAAMERALAKDLAIAGYHVLNIVRSNKPINKGDWRKVRKAFAEHFPKLNDVDSEVDLIMMKDNPLYKPRKKWSNGIALPKEAGIYAIFLEGISSLPEEWQLLLGRSDKLLYIGIGTGLSGLDGRLETHFSGPHSTTDTFRRSVGAVLREHIQLKLTLRSSKRSQYSFKNENVLSEWIRKNCRFKYLCPTDCDVGELEEDYICKYSPPLNIDHNPNKIEKLRDARAECRHLVGRHD
jgi:hypothetical protein